MDCSWSATRGFGPDEWRILLGGRPWSWVVRGKEEGLLPFGKGEELGETYGPQDTALLIEEVRTIDGTMRKVSRVSPEDSRKEAEPTGILAVFHGNQRHLTT